MSKGRVSLGSWALRVLTWDAMLPACVAFLPMGIKALFPNQRGAMEITAVILPIVAFLLRLRAGRRQIASNRCSKGLQRFQHCVFFLGILPLVLIDCFVILSDLMPKGALLDHGGDRLIFGIMILVYIIPMVIAMYPGRTELSADDADDFFAYHGASMEDIRGTGF